MKAGTYVDAEVRKLLVFEENLDMKCNHVNSYSKTLLYTFVIYNSLDYMNIATFLLSRTFIRCYCNSLNINISVSLWTKQNILHTQASSFCFHNFHNRYQQK